MKVATHPVQRLQRTPDFGSATESVRQNRIVVRVLGALLAVIVGASVVSHTGAAVAAAQPDSYGLVDPTTGVWHFFQDDHPAATFYYGDPGDYPFVGDWDCDGVDTPGLYRQSDGYVYLRNANTQGVADVSFFFGNPGDVPIAGDFNADGCDTVSIYRPTEARFYIINQLGTSDAGLGPADYSFLFGDMGDKPFVGDFNGNGQSTIGLHRETTGLVYFRNTNTTGTADNQFTFGDPADRLVAGDWNADGSDAPGVFRPSDLTMYLKYINTQGNADESHAAGQSSWIPVAGHFGDMSSAPMGPTEMLVFEKDGHLHTMFTDASTHTLTTGKTFQRLPRWSPGGQKILYEHTDPDFPANNGIYVINPDGTDATRVWDASEGDWSPDGKYIVFVSTRISAGDPETKCPGDEIFLLDCESNLFLLDLFTGSIRQVTYDGDNTEVAWSPNGTMIAFISDTDGDREVFTVEPDGTGLTQITHNDVDDQSPSWVPDSSGLVYSTDTGGQLDIWLSAFGESAKRLTDHPSNDSDPAVSSDGIIAFSRQYGADEDASVIYLMSLSGSDETSTGQYGLMPDWRP